jgi:hypothetical protein
LADVLLRRTQNSILSVLKLRINSVDNTFEIFHDNKLQSKLSFLSAVEENIWYYLAVGIDISTGNGHIYISQDSFQDVISNNMCTFIRIQSNLLSSKDNLNGKKSFISKSFFN